MKIEIKLLAEIKFFEINIFKFKLKKISIYIIF